jgi:hypothetical protein
MAENSARLGYNTENNNAFCVEIFNSKIGVNANGSLVYENKCTMIENELQGKVN